MSVNNIKELRQRTGAGVMDCKNALAECDGDIDKAIAHLRKTGMAAAAKKAGRIASEGVVHSYIHGGGRIGVLLEVNCETDFVARTDNFKDFVQNVALHVAAAGPRWLNEDEVPAGEVEKEKEILTAQALEQGKPANIVEKMVSGRISKFYSENCLMNQAYVKDPDMTIGDLLKQLIADIGENCNIRRFVRFEMGEGLEKKVHDLAAEVAEQMGG
jgi:elongation factor Ts